MNAAASSNTLAASFCAPIPVSVDLGPYYNLTKRGGIERQGNALSYEQLVYSPIAADLQYNIPDAAEANGVISSSIALPSGKFSTLRVLGMSVNGNQMHRTFVVHYADGTSAYYVYQYDLPLDVSRTVVSVQLPTTSNVVVLAVSLEP